MFEATLLQGLPVVSDVDFAAALRLDPTRECDGSRPSAPIQMPDEDPLAAPLVITAGPVPDALKGAHYQRGPWQVSADEARFELRDVLRMHLIGGREVRYALCAGADTADLIALFTGSVLPVVLHQRGQRFLRGTALVWKGAAVLIAGLPAVGKSTVAAWLLAQGASLLADDLVGVSMGADGSVCVSASPLPMRLAVGEIEVLGLSCDDAWPIRRDAGGVWVHPPAARRASGMHRLDRVVEIDAERSAARPGAHRLQGPQAAAALYDQISHTPLLPRARARALLAGVAPLAGQLAVWRVLRLRGDIGATVTSVSKVLG